MDAVGVGVDTEIKGRDVKVISFMKMRNINPLVNQEVTKTDTQKITINQNRIQN